jgi:nitrous oxide reductase accessory protein NosL
MPAERERSGMPTPPRSAITRLRAIAGVALVLPVSFAGCLGGDSTASFEPITLSEQRACDECGMILEDHPGPVGQVHFEDDEPEGGRPAEFCSSVCTYAYRFDSEDAGRQPLVTFLTDYSRVDKEVFRAGGDVLFSSHVEAAAFAPTTELTVVVGSEVSGAMGPAIVPFGDDAVVESFLAEYGGQTMDVEAVDRGTLEVL